jgi:predicted glycoside hydrolase/deacetylase ChbG (UPF0249 family)
MIIVTADDFGKTRHATNCILECVANKSITSASAMVYMEDSERAAALALKAGVEVGLHINMTMPFSVDNIAEDIRSHQGRVVSYLTKNRMAQVVYNPRLASSFDFLFKAQLDEFLRLYGRPPAFYNGHHHMHLSANMLIGKLLPKGARVRRTFSFYCGEKDLLNLVYRRLLDVVVTRRYVSTEYLFSIEPLLDLDRLRRIFAQSNTSNVELEVHPENAEEREFLLGDEYLGFMKAASVGNFSGISVRQ